MSDEMDRNVLEMPENLITGLSLYQYRNRALSVLAERDALRAENERLRNLEKQVRALYSDADEWDCDGLGLYAPFAAWHPVLDALEAIDAAMKATSSPDWRRTQNA